MCKTNQSFPLLVGRSGLTWKTSANCHLTSTPVTTNSDMQVQCMQTGCQRPWTVLTCSFYYGVLCFKAAWKYCASMLMCCFESAHETGVKVERLEAEAEPPKRNTVSVRLSLFAAHNAFHHCEQCHHYSEPTPAAQVRTYVIDHVMHQHVFTYF